MCKKLLAIVIAVTMVFVFTACDEASRISDHIKYLVAQTIKGDIKCDVGKTYDSQWFQFTIEYIEKVDSYADYSPAEGHMLIDVLITEKGTYDDPEPSPMGTFDFYMYSSIFEDYIFFPLGPLDDTMMPEEFDLAYGETVVYHMVYEIPDDVPDLELMYTEWRHDDTEGATFIIDINLNEL